MRIPRGDALLNKILQPLLIILYIVYRWPQIQRFVVLEGPGLWRCNSSNLMHGELYSTIQGGALKSRPSFQIFIIHLHWSSISWQNKTQFKDYMYIEHVFPQNQYFFIKHWIRDNREMYSNVDTSNIRKSPKRYRKCAEFWSRCKFKKT